MLGGTSRGRRFFPRLVLSDLRLKICYTKRRGTFTHTEVKLDALNLPTASSSPSSAQALKAATPMIKRASVISLMFRQRSQILFPREKEGRKEKRNCNDEGGRRDVSDDGSMLLLVLNMQAKACLRTKVRTSILPGRKKKGKMQRAQLSIFCYIGVPPSSMVAMNVLSICMTTADINTIHTCTKRLNTPLLTLTERCDESESIKNNLNF